MKSIIVLILISVSTILIAASEEPNKEKPMTKEDMKPFHEALAPGLFNACWDLLEKTDRSRDDDNRLINFAHASLFHWKQIGAPINQQRGEWIISHVYAVLGHKEAALYHAENCYELTVKHSFTDFDLAYAYEAMARAYALNGNREKFAEFHSQAVKAMDQISKDGDRKQFAADLDSGNWNGMK
ncbi:MAG: hypothetical protein PHI68_07670 [Candidatus Cloacimonetes bacterium]|nr:hypothetical protein [Candidatus Cloacimonadota bacterium]